MRLERFVFLVLCLLFFMPSFCKGYTDSWNQWRGGIKQGVYHTNKNILHWTDSSNIVWKSAIKGEGHSSPVVEGDNVIITSAYSKSRYIPLIKSLRIVIFLLTTVFICILCFAIFSLLNKNATLHLFHLLSLFTLFYLLGLMVFAVLIDTNYAEFNEPNHIAEAYRWFYTGNFVALFAISTLLINNNVRFGFIVVSTLVIYYLMLYLMRPFPDYYPETGQYILEVIHKGIALQIVAVVIVFIPKAIIKFIPAKSKVVPITISTKNKWFLFLVGTIIALVSYKGINSYRLLLYEIPSGSINWPFPDLFYRDGYIFFRLSLLGAFLVFISNINRTSYFSKSTSNRLLISLLLIASLVATKNQIFIGKEVLTHAISCYSLKTGKLKWRKEVFEGKQIPVHIDNSQASPTPIIINDTIYAYFGTPGMMCLSIDGDKLWENTMLEFNGIHGIGASPIYHKGSIIVVNHQSQDPYIAKINAKTGDIVWKSIHQSWEGLHGEHRTPTIINYQNKDYILAWSNERFMAFDFIDGRIVKEFPLEHPSHEMAASILIIDDYLFAPNIKKSYLINIPDLFNNTDRCFKWQCAMKNKGPKCSSPVYFNKQIFTLSDNGHLFCIDFHSGRVLNQKRFKGVFLSSLTLVNQHLYLNSTKGTTYIVEANASLNIVATNNINDGIYSSLAVDENSIILRSNKYLWRIGKQ